MEITNNTRNFVSNDTKTQSSCKENKHTPTNVSRKQKQLNKCKGSARSKKRKKVYGAPEINHEEYVYIALIDDVKSGKMFDGTRFDENKTSIRMSMSTSVKHRAKKNGVTKIGPGTLVIVHPYTTDPNGFRQEIIWIYNDEERKALNDKGDLSFITDEYCPYEIA